MDLKDIEDKEILTEEFEKSYQELVSQYNECIKNIYPSRLLIFKNYLFKIEQEINPDIEVAYIDLGQVERYRDILNSVDKMKYQFLKRKEG